jgi:hypothetical protein
MSSSITLEVSDINQHLQDNNADIRSYLDLMMLEYDAGTDQCLFLPSLISLSECFNCSPVEVHHVLNEMRERGCDFFIMGFESPITLWYPLRLGLKKSS